MSSRIFIDPILFFPDHPFPTRHFARWASLVEGTRLGAIAKSLGTIPFLPWIPMINDYFHSHLAAPNTIKTFGFICACAEAAVAALAINFQFRRGAMPGRRIMFAVRCAFWPMFGIRVKRIHFFANLRCQELLARLKRRRFHLHIQHVIAKPLDMLREIRAESSNHCLRNMNALLG